MAKSAMDVMYTITIDLFKGLKKMVSIGNLVYSPTRRVGESFFNYEYLWKLEAKIWTAMSVYAKTPENPPHCHVPLKDSPENEYQRANSMFKHSGIYQTSPHQWAKPFCPDKKRKMKDMHGCNLLSTNLSKSSGYSTRLLASHP